jgi:Zn-dependent protease
MIRISKSEISDFAKSWFVVSLAFAIVMVGFYSFTSLFIGFAAAGFTVGIGFLAHELGHKFIAQHYGCFAEFKAYNNMLLLAFVMSFFGFIFAAPGAVVINGAIDRARNGRISAAGPFMNLLVAIIFFLLFLTTPFKVIFIYGFTINTWIALFNLIPLTPFDGKNIYKWSKTIYVVMLAVALMFMIFQYSMR